MTETQVDPFSTASEAKLEGAGDKFEAKDHVGDMLLITPTEYKTGVKTKFSRDADDLKDVVIADIVIIKPKPEDCTKLTQAALFQGRLIGATKGKVGNGMVLGKLITEDTDKGNAAYDLEDPTPAARDAALAYLAAQRETEEPPF